MDNKVFHFGGQNLFCLGNVDLVVDKNNFVSKEAQGISTYSFANKSWDIEWILPKTS